MQPIINTYTYSELQEGIQQMEGKINNFLGFAQSCPSDSFIFMDENGEYNTYTPHSTGLAQWARSYAEQPSTFGMVVSFGASGYIQAADQAMMRTINTIKHIASQAMIYSQMVSEVIAGMDQLDNLVDIGRKHSEIGSMLCKFQEVKKKFKSMRPLFEARSADKFKQFEIALGDLNEKVNHAKHTLELNFNQRIAHIKSTTLSARSEVSERQATQSLSGPSSLLPPPSSFLPSPPPCGSESPLPHSSGSFTPPPPPPPMPMTPEMSIGSKPKKTIHERMMEERLSPERFYSYNPPSMDQQKLLRELLSKAQGAEEQQKIEERLKGERNCCKFNDRAFKTLVEKLTTDELRMLIDLQNNEVFNQDQLLNYDDICTILKRNQAEWKRFFDEQNGRIGIFQAVLAERLSGASTSPVYNKTPAESGKKREVKTASTSSARGPDAMMNELKERMLKPKLSPGLERTIPRGTIPEKREKVSLLQEMKGKFTSVAESSSKSPFKLKPVKLTEEQKKQKMEAAKRELFMKHAQDYVKTLRQELLALTGDQKGGSFMQIADAYKLDTADLLVIIDEKISDCKKREGRSEEELRQERNRLENDLKKIENLRNRYPGAEAVAKGERPESEAELVAKLERQVEEQFLSE